MYSTNSPSFGFSLARDAKGNLGSRSAKGDYGQSQRVVLLREFLSLLTVANGIPAVRERV